MKKAKTPTTMKRTGTTIRSLQRFRRRDRTRKMAMKSRSLMEAIRTGTRTTTARRTRKMII
jgi:hypothetical protein